VENRKNTYGSRRNYLRPGIEPPERGYSFPAESMNRNPYEDSRSCTAPDTACPGLALATAYVPIQPFTGLVGPDEALEHGSSFDNLFIPYQKGGCMS